MSIANGLFYFLSGIKLLFPTSVFSDKINEITSLVKIYGGKSMKKTLRKFIVTSALALLIGTSFTQAASANSLPFTDVSGRHTEAVAFIYDNGFANGISNSKFGTNLNITRGDAAIILANLLGLDTITAPDSGFKDIKGTRHEGAVNALHELGYVSGFTDQTFRPSEQITRGAMAKMLVDSFGFPITNEPTHFTDVNSVFKPYIEALYWSGITSGATETTFGTHSKITRGDFAVFLYNSFLYYDYVAFAQSTLLLNATTTEITLTEVAPEEYTAQEIAAMFYPYVELSDGSVLELTISNPVLSVDRSTLTITHDSLEGKAGTIRVDDTVTPFDFTSGM